MPTRPTSVRIDSKLYPEVEARAKRAGVNVSDFMRQAVYEKLAETDAESTRQEIENLREAIELMRDEMAKFARAVLVVSGSKKEFSEDLADEWVAKTFGAKYAKGGGE